MNLIAIVLAVVAAVLGIIDLARQGRGVSLTTVGLIALSLAALIEWWLKP